MIEKIKDKLQLGTLIKEGAFLHMRCFTHLKFDSKRWFRSCEGWSGKNSR